MYVKKYMHTCMHMFVRSVVARGLGSLCKRPSLVQVLAALERS